jgi:reverse transcriptase-like protein
VTRLTQGQLSRLDLSAALEAELAVAGSLLPPPFFDQSIADRRPKYLALLASRATSEVISASPEVILAKKPRGLRPVLVIPLASRVIYRALVSKATSELPALDRSNAAYSGFWNGPLKERSVRVVGLADVSACYQYIDHMLLENELVRQTGEAELAALITSLLRDLSGRSFGIPQNQWPSHVLAEVILGFIERRLARRGYKVWRYSDDFRVGGRDLAEVSRGLEDLERELNNSGLTLNDEKTSIRSRKSYRDLLKRSNKRLAEVRKLVTDDLAEWDPYTGDISQPAKDDVTLIAALQVIADWLEDLRAGKTRYGYEAISERQLLTGALSSFQVLESDEGLQYCARLLLEEPELTPRVAAYLGQRSMTSEEGRIVIDHIIADPSFPLSDWQALWLVDALRDLPELSEAQIAWARSLIEREPSRLMAARAAATLAGFDQVSEQEISTVLSAQREAGQGDAVHALAARVLPNKSSRILDSVIADSPEWSWVAQLAQNA